MSFRFDGVFDTVPVILILRGLSPKDSVAAAAAAWGLGVRAVEVPLQGESGRRALRAVVEAGQLGAHAVGAGTVVAPEQVDEAAALGAVFTVAPGFDAAVSERSRELGLPHLPGVATATDIQAASAAGHQWMKAFPASVLSERWFRAMRGPFPNVRFVATGGMSPADLTTYVEAGAAAIALGSAVADPSVFAALRSALTAFSPSDHLSN